MEGAVEHKVSRTHTVSMAPHKRTESGGPPPILSTEAGVFGVGAIVFQLVILIIYAVWLDYSDPGDVPELYNYFRDVNVMIFIGFAFLMTFLRRYGYSAVTYTFVTSALVVQWSVIIQAVVTQWENDGLTDVNLNMDFLLNGLFCAGASMITFGGFLGKSSPTMMLFLAFFQPMFYWLNFWINDIKLEAFDIGGGMYIHTFGAYFGLAATWFLTSAETHNHRDNCSCYSSDLFSFIGTIWLWVMWPSFNGAIAPAGVSQLRAIANTFLSICASAVVATAMSRLVGHNKRMDMVHIQNSTLAGGVVMGTAAHLNLTPAGAVAGGIAAGLISVLGYRYLTPFLNNKLGIQDVCGIHNLHGMPGVLSAIIAIIAAAHAQSDKARYSHELYEELFPRGDSQAAYQVAALFITLGIAIGAGIVCGFILKMLKSVTRELRPDNYFNDDVYFEVPSDYYYVIDNKKDKELEPVHQIAT